MSGNVLGSGVERIVRSGVGDVVKKRLLVRSVFFDRCDGMIGECNGREKIIGKFGNAFVVLTEKSRASSFEIRVSNGRTEKIAAAVPETVAALKTAIDWAMRSLVSVVLFSAESSLVSRSSKDFAERLHVRCEEFLSSPALARIEARQKACSCRGAFSIVVKLGEAHAFVGDAINVGGWDFSTKTTDV